jgi:hypothetical protein
MAKRHFNRLLTATGPPRQYPLLSHHAFRHENCNPRNPLPHQPLDSLSLRRRRHRRRHLHIHTGSLHRRRRTMQPAKGGDFAMPSECCLVARRAQHRE